MKVRKVLLQGCYYYLLFSTTAVVFLFVTTLNNVFNGHSEWQAPWFGEANQEVSLFWALLLVDQLAGLFTIVLLKRKHQEYPRWSFVLLFVMQFVLFVLPSLISLLLAIALSMRFV